MRFNAFSVALMTSAALVAAPAFAAGGDEEEQVLGGGGGGLADIIVSAQKRDTKLEKTPMTINVVTGDLLRSEGVKEIKDLKASVPGLVMNESPGGLPGVTIRGIGTSANNQLFEQSVGLFVDGIYHPRQRQYRDALFDVERVEVVKGSQGVLFGKNTSVGAVSLISRRPGDETGGHLQVQHELEYGSTILDGGLDLRLNDTLGIRLSGMYEDTAGYVENRAKNRMEASGERYVARAIVDWDVTPEFNALLKLQWGRMNTLGNPFQHISSQNVTALQGAGVADGGLQNYVKYESGENVPDTDDRQINFDPSLVLDYSFDSGYSITSTTGYSRYSFSNNFDSDATPLSLAHQQFNERFGQFSQEIRITSPADQPIDFIVGGTYIKSDSDYNYKSFYDGLPTAAGVVYGEISQRVVHKQDTWALFGNANWRFAEGLTLTVGGRYSIDKKDAVYTRTLLDPRAPAGGFYPGGEFPSWDPNGLGVVGVIIGNGTSGADQNTHKTFDFSGTLSYALNDRSTLYVSAGRGNKGAAYNNQARLGLPYPDPFLVPGEKATTFEAGIKGRFLDGNLYASLAGFILNVDDMQDNFFDPTIPAFTFRSIDAKTRGVEGEATLRLWGPLTASGNFSWLPEAKSTDGSRLQRAPKFTSNLALRGEGAISDDFTLNGSVNWMHSSNYLHQPATAPGDNNSLPYDLINARVELTYVPAGVSIFLSGTNLTKAVYRQFAFGSILQLGQVGALNEPRMFTLGARVKF